MPLPKWETMTDESQAMVKKTGVGIGAGILVVWVALGFIKAILPIMFLGGAGYVGWKVLNKKQSWLLISPWSCSIATHREIYRYAPSISTASILQWFQRTSTIRPPFQWWTLEKICLSLILKISHPKMSWRSFYICFGKNPDLLTEGMKWITRKQHGWMHSYSDSRLPTIKMEWRPLLWRSLAQALTVWQIYVQNLEHLQKRERNPRLSRPSISSRNHSGNIKLTKPH